MQQIQRTTTTKTNSARAPALASKKVGDVTKTTTKTTKVTSTTNKATENNGVVVSQTINVEMSTEPQLVKDNSPVTVDNSLVATD